MSQNRQKLPEIPQFGMKNKEKTFENHPDKDSLSTEKLPVIDIPSKLSTNLSFNVNSKDDNNKMIIKRPKSVFGDFGDKISEMEPTRLVDFLNQNIVGRQLMIDTPFGTKLKLYADYTASGQDLHFLNELLMKTEDYYANTHTEVSATGAYMNNLLNQAESAILKALKASEKDYFVVTGGSGSTFAIEMTQKFLGTYIPPATKLSLMKAFDKGTTWEDVKNRLRQKNQLPLVIVSHYEHHSNEVTWRNQLCDVVECPARLDGHVNIDRLEAILEKQSKIRNSIIGSISAGSNVTGIKSDVDTIAKILKKYGALCFFDYAAVGPYVEIDLSRRIENGDLLIDGIYISPHKFLGGTATSGLLIFNRHVYKNSIEPSHGGGGTVDYVGRKGQLFTRDVAHREKSGTPGILQVIKTGLVFHLKSLLQSQIDTKEHEHIKGFFTQYTEKWSKWIQILGPPDPDDRVCIISFLVHHPTGPRGRRYLHQNLVVKLFNDIFGIQSRSGCACAGPYGHYLLSIDDDMSNRFLFWIETHPELGDNSQLQGFKPGWARINLHYTFTDYELQYLFYAIGYVGEHGYKFLPLYSFDPTNGSWTNDDASFRTRSLSHFGIDSMAGDERKYLGGGSTFKEGEKLRAKCFEEQKKWALDLLGKLPQSQTYDHLPEMPYCFFYVERGKVLRKNLITAKSKAYNIKFDD